MNCIKCGNPMYHPTPNKLCPECEGKRIDEYIKKQETIQQKKNIPEGLDAAVLCVFEQHIGKKNVISRSGLVWKLAGMGFAVDERPVRECIKQLRRVGHLICSMPGIGGGYYMAESKAEFDEFIQTEFDAKIYDMLETTAAMKQSARVRFGEGVQMELL